MLEGDAQTYYDILGVDRSATADDITFAYRQVLDETNTFDAQSDSEEETIELIKTVTLAYRTLVDEQKRREYDAALDGCPLSEEEDETAVYNVEQVSLAESPSLTSTGLATLKDGNSAEVQSLTPRVVYEVGQAFSPRNESEIPEEWKQERAFFEEHFEEILKPAPKVDLVGTKKGILGEENNVATIAEWDDLSPTAPASTRFGTIPSSNELSHLQAVPTPRRAIARSLMADPFDLMVYIGLPVMGVILAIEVFVYMR
jgi:curved DNA-binding protein CbpA